MDPRRTLAGMLLVRSIMGENACEPPAHAGPYMCEIVVVFSFPYVYAAGSDAEHFLICKFMALTHRCFRAVGV